MRAMRRSVRCQESERNKRNGKTASLMRVGRLTHAERVIDPASGLTKGDLARYYVRPRR